MTTPRSARALPRTAEVVVIGGGAIGTSIAFHLAEAGVPDVVLLERDELGQGSTCKAAGGVRAQFSDRINIELGARSLEAFGRFAERPGQEIDLHRVGYLFLLSTPERVASFERDVALQNELGVPSRMIDVAEAEALSPLIATDGLLAAAYSPDDGHCTPESVVLGYATGARRHGATLRHRRHASPASTCTAAKPARCTPTAVAITAGTVVCAAGAWSRAIGEMVGTSLPVTPLRRQILFTEPMPDLARGRPVHHRLRDHASTSTAKAAACCWACPTPTRSPASTSTYSDDWLPRLGEAMRDPRPAAARRRPRQRLGRALRGDPGPQRAHRALDDHAERSCTPPASPATASCRPRPSARSSATCTWTARRSWTPHRSRADRFARDGATRPESHIV